jgi:hypothetical protein
MRRKEIKLEFGKKKTATMLATSCWHFGNPSISKEGISNFIKKAKKHPWIHHGDIIEGITKGDRRFSIEEHKMVLLDAVDIAIGELEKANKTCVGLLKGNHDQTPSTDIGDVSEFIAVRSKVPYLTATAFLKVIGQTGHSIGFTGHGTGGSNPKAGEPERKDVTRKIWLRNLLGQFTCDWGGIGHTHRFTVAEPCYEEKLTFGDDGNVRREPELVKAGWYYTAPSMFTTYDLHADTSNYAEMQLFGATDIGWIEMVFNRDGQIGCIREVYATGKVKQEHYPRIVG